MFERMEKERSKKYAMMERTSHKYLGFLQG